MFSNRIKHAWPMRMFNDFARSDAVLNRLVSTVIANSMNTNGYGSATGRNYASLQYCDDTVRFTYMYVLKF